MDEVTDVQRGIISRFYAEHVQTHDRDKPEIQSLEQNLSVFNLGDWRFGVLEILGCNIANWTARR
jgi:hypothetical protein